MLTSINRREFLRAAALTTGGLALAGRPAISASSNGVPASRLARLVTGANVSLWFRFPRNATAEHFQNYIPESEAAYVAQMGLKHVRLCVAPKVIMDASTGAIREERGKQLEAAVAEHRANWLRDFGEILAANRIGWAVSGAGMRASGPTASM